MSAEKAKASILDGLPKNEAEAREAVEMAGRFLETILEDSEFGEMFKNSHVIQRMNEGATLAEAIELEEEELEALYAVGHQQLAAQDIAKAKDSFLNLVQLNPLDERFHYGLGVALQLNGEIAPAARAYLGFLALDADNAEGYMRLGECFLFSGELENAEEVFRIGKRIAEEDPAHADVVPYAAKMLDTVRARLSETGAS
jgi:Flp pilus assembly protein TadD